jgi:hypothetical protein
MEGICESGGGMLEQGSAAGSPVRQGDGWYEEAMEEARQAIYQERLHQRQSGKEAGTRRTTR